MNETLSLLLATTILALGGVGLYMYKSDEEDHDEDDYDQDNIHINEEDEISDDEISDDESIEEYYKSPPRAQVRKPKTKTKTTRKSGGTKRRY